MIEKGVENLRDFELLAILLRTGVRGKNAIELSKYILNKFPTEKFVDLKLEELLLIDGVDAGKASTILASIELVKRATKKHSNNLPMILSSQDVVDQMTDTRVKKKETSSVFGNTLVYMVLNPPKHILFNDLNNGIAIHCFML